MPAMIEFDARPTAIDGLLFLTMKQVGDDRGTVREFYRESALSEPALPRLGPWRQVNVTQTRQGAVRGIHAEAMVKLVGVVVGEAFAAYVDLRPGSGTFGKVVTTTLTPGAPGARARGRGQRVPGDLRGRLRVPLLLRRRVAAGHGGRGVHAARSRAGDRLALADRP